MIIYRVRKRFQYNMKLGFKLRFNGNWAECVRVRWRDESGREIDLGDLCPINMSGSRPRFPVLGFISFPGRFSLACGLFDDDSEEVDEHWDPGIGTQYC